MPDSREHRLVDDEQYVLSIIENVWDPVEIKTLMAVSLLHGHEQPVPIREITEFPPLLKGVRGDGSDRDPAERVRDGLMTAVARGILIALKDDLGGTWIVVASPQMRRRVLLGGFEELDSLPEYPAALRPERPDIFGLYEQNIGMVTPLMADRLTEALELYPEEWIRDAIGEAVAYNKRNWRYIQRILENWTTEGRADETNRRDHEKHLDSEKYLRGKYASLFRKR